ncbi:MAG: DUF1028 domain-containing protein [Nostocoides sp.]
MTFSIVARSGSAYGIAVASKFLAVGSVVPGARLGVGAVATQSFARVAYIPELLESLAAGQDAPTALAARTAADDLREERQVGVVGTHDAATFTGTGCMAWAGGVCASGTDTAYAIQGNILVGPEVVRDMEAAWLGSEGQDFTSRLLVALLAGDAAGGDARGRQSAAMYAVEPGAGYDSSGVLADLRVDEHPSAPTELARIHEMHTLYFGRAEGVQPLEGDVGAEVRRRLDALGVTGGDTAADLAQWAGEVNLETRLSPDGIDRRVLVELRAATP